MLLRAPRPQRAKTPIIMRTTRPLSRRVDVQVVAVVESGAVAGAVVGGAFGAGADIVFVEVVAGVAFFAEAFEPVLAD